MSEPNPSKPPKIETKVEEEKKEDDGVVAEEWILLLKYFIIWFVKLKK